MEFLPREVLDEIAFYLNKEDLLSCSLVCKFWRNAFNSNRYWFNLCRNDFYVDKLTEEDDKFRLKYKDSLIHDDDISEICPWRWKYIQENRVFSNWLESGFSIESLGPLKGILPPLYHTYDSNVLVFPQVPSYFKVYRLSNPLIELESIGPIRCLYISYFKIVDGIFVYVEGQIVRVFTTEESNFTLAIIEYHPLR